MDYCVYSEFDANQHAKTFRNYLEVIIHPSGKVEYAVPSHTEKMIEIVCKKQNMTRDELMKSVPEVWYADIGDWLCMKSGCIAVWTGGYILGVPNRFQIHKLDELVRLGLMKPWDVRCVERSRNNRKLLIEREKLYNL